VAGAAVKSIVTSCSSTSLTNGLNAKLTSVPGLMTESRAGASDWIPTNADAEEHTSINTNRGRNRRISYLYFGWNDQINIFLFDRLAHARVAKGRCLAIPVVVPVGVAGDVDARMCDE